MTNILKQHYAILPGKQYPGGATVVPEGINFSIFSPHATCVELLLFENTDSPQPFQIISLEQRYHRTFFFWHVLVRELPVGAYYAWRIDGPGDVKHTGFRFNRNKVLLDPWARAVSDKLWNHQHACGEDDNTATSMRAIVVDNRYDWEDDQPLQVHP